MFHPMHSGQRRLAVRATYVVVVLLATLADLHFSPELGDAVRRLARAFTPSLEWRDAVDGLRNIALFAGLGSVWVVTSPRRRDASEEVGSATLAGLLLSAAVEFLQAFSPVRTSSFVDVTTNTLGAFAGALLFSLLVTRLQRLRRGEPGKALPAVAIAWPYLGAVLAEAFTPLFRNDAMAEAHGGPLTRLAIALRELLPLSAGEVPFSDIPLFAAAGALAVLLDAERAGRARTGWAKVAVAGGALVVAAHVAHGAIGLSVRLEAAATDALALGAGAWFAARWAGRAGRERDLPAQALRGAYAVLLMLWGWRPFVPETSWHAIVTQFSPARFVPLASLAARVDVFSAVHVAQQFVLYLPLGALMAVAPPRPTRRATILAIGLAFGIELGHVVVAGRYFDVTNALIGCAGIVMGRAVMRRAGFDAAAPVAPPPR